MQNLLQLHQIYYSEETRRMLDPGFMPLDNSRNERPDWREYWPIRNFLRSNTLQPDGYYGFFSPKFGAKTGLDAAQVRNFCGQHAGSADAVLFSPYFDHGAFFRNPIEQGQAVHKAGTVALLECARLIAPGFRHDEDAASSRNTVFCNYFVASGRFWQRWFEACELVFATAEAGGTDLARSLNGMVRYEGAQAPTKVFVIERIASLLLITEPHWKSVAFDATRLPFAGGPFAPLRNEMIIMDALKIAYQEQPWPEYRRVFDELRNAITAAIQAGKPAP